MVNLCFPKINIYISWAGGGGRSLEARPQGLPYDLPTLPSPRGSVGLICGPT